MHGYSEGTSWKPTNKGARFCCRCKLPLTDAASCNEGIGPWCRKLDNAVLARLIPSNLPEALDSFKQVDVLNLAPDTVRDFIELEGVLTAADASLCEDWRVVAKKVEWMLSFPQTHQNTEKLKSLVLALGYVGLVALWNGEAATGKATVFFTAENRLFVSGPNNKAARIALKKVSGATFHCATEAVKAGWSVPASQHEAFKLAIIKHYPNFYGLADALKSAKEYALIGYNTSKTLAVTLKPVVSIIQEGAYVKVKTPYSPEFVTDLKLVVPYMSRKWDPVERVWVVGAGFKNKVGDVVAKHFPQ
jgi:hypothetical protein